MTWKVSDNQYGRLS